VRLRVGKNHSRVDASIWLRGWLDNDDHLWAGMEGPRTAINRRELVNLDSAPACYTLCADVTGYARTLVTHRCRRQLWDHPGATGRRH
jgi:hypothetical protein